MELLIMRVSGIIFGLFTIIYKCKHISCCGIVIDKDIDDETKIFYKTNEE